MSSGLSDVGAQLLLSQLLGVTSVPAGYWVGLATDQPGEGMDGDIVADLEPDPAAGYGRVFYALDAEHWALNGRLGTNLLGVDFGIPSSDWGQVSHYVLLDSETSGQLIGFGDFLVPDYLSALTSVLIPPGGMVLGLYALEDSISP